MNINSREIKFFIQANQNNNEVIENIKRLITILTLSEKVIINKNDTKEIINELEKINVFETYDTLKILYRLINELNSINSKGKVFLI